MTAFFDIFVKTLKHLSAQEQRALLEALHEDPVISLHLHPIKSKHLNIGDDRVPWYSAGRYLDQRPIFTLDPAFQAGAYYVQEASSMLVAHILQEWMKDHRVEVALDLCAAPGGKTTHN